MGGPCLLVLPSAQTSLVPYVPASAVWGPRRERGWGPVGPPGVPAAAQGSGLPAPLPSLVPSLFVGVPLLFVIPWGIVKYLFEDEG